ncbi:MAG: energy transducer TonB [Ramlibacter sp.]|nr:energy transducer TonB [Ramlibacter sp.]
MEQEAESLRKSIEAPSALDKEVTRKRLTSLEEKLKVYRHEVDARDKWRASTEMQNYMKKLQSRIEDCGTRHFPYRDGRRIYGGGVIAIEIDRQGNFQRVETIELSGDHRVSSHLISVVKASAPFGPWPVTPESFGAIPLKTSKISQTFQFKRDDFPSSNMLPIAESCMWPPVDDLGRRAKLVTKHPLSSSEKNLWRTASEKKARLRVKVLRDGRVGAAVIVASSGNPELDAALERVAIGFRYEPAQWRDGRATDSWIEELFELDEIKQ